MAAPGDERIRQIEGLSPFSTLEKEVARLSLRVEQLEQRWHPGRARRSLTNPKNTDVSAGGRLVPPKKGRRQSPTAFVFSAGGAVPAEAGLEAQTDAAAELILIAGGSWDTAWPVPVLVRHAAAEPAGVGSSPEPVGSVVRSKPLSARPRSS